MRWERGEALQRYGPWELRDGGNLLAFRDICHSPGEAHAGNPYNTVCQLKVVSGEFAGVGEWECDWQDVHTFVQELERLYHFQRQEVEFRDIEWGNWLKFQMDRTGHVTVTGRLYGGMSMQTLEFHFRTDQSALQPFLQQMRQVFDTL